MADDLSGVALSNAIAANLGQSEPPRLLKQKLDRGLLKTIYDARGNQPVWLDGTGAPTESAKTAIELLSAAETEGLNPQSYHLGEIEELAKPADLDSAVNFELSLTDGLGAYLHDFSVGRIKVGRYRDKSFDKPFDIAQAIGSVATMNPGDLRNYAAGLAPAMPDYVALKKALATMRDQARAGDWPKLPGGSSLKQGMTDPAIAVLRQRLGVAAGPKPQFFDAALAGAVQAFQQTHAIKDDGAVGKDTRSALDMSIDDRIAEIIASMERMRWLPHDLGPHYVMVNVGGFWVRLVDNGQLTLQLPIIVGTTQRETPLLTSQIENVIINPTWTVPPTITKKDLLPKLRKDPGYLAQRGIDLYRRGEDGLETVDPQSVDWQATTNMSRYVFRQPEGDENPLGHYKFNFPNPYAIYLHDTPEQAKFSAALRSFSSGCVRVENAQKLAETILGEQGIATPERIAELRTQGDTKSIALHDPVRIYITYLSAWLDAQGNLIMGPDLYQQDAGMAGEITGRKPDELPAIRQW